MSLPSARPLSSLSVCVCERMSAWIIMRVISSNGALIAEKHLATTSSSADEEYIKTEW